jgi:molybdopterin-guanine dinucleotide biosynthesis protein A
VVLAGGAARRFPGKLGVEVEGRPLLTRAVAALRAVLPEVVVLAKPGATLPAVEVAVWEEPPEPAHPLAGVGWALGRAGGRAVLACAGDMPCVDQALVARLAADASEAVAVVPRHPGGIEPLLALYRPPARDTLLAAAAAGTPARDAVAALHPAWLDYDDAAPFLNVNRPEDLPGGFRPG